MKSEIFKNAWQLVREYCMTFSQALIEAWKTAKREIVANKINDMNLSELKATIKWNAAIKNLKTIFYPVRQKTNTTSVDNSGAAAWYGIGVYNGD